MTNTSFCVMAANSFTNVAFVVVRLATAVQLAAVEVARLMITSMVLMCSLAWAGVGAGAT